MFYDLTQLCNHVWSGGGVGDAGEIKTISGEHFPVNIPYFAWDDLEPPPQTSVGFRTTLWEPQRGAACLPACLPRRSHRPRKYLGASAKRRLNLFCFPPFRLLLLLLPLLLVLFPHTHTHIPKVISQDHGEEWLEHGKHTGRFNRNHCLIDAEHEDWRRGLWRACVFVCAGSRARNSRLCSNVKRQVVD